MYVASENKPEPLHTEPYTAQKRSPLDRMDTDAEASAPVTLLEGNLTDLRVLIYLISALCHF